jgi:hypothetical protein
MNDLQLFFKTLNAGCMWPPMFGLERFYYDGDRFELHLGVFWIHWMQ